MTWIHAVIILGCLASIMTCGLHSVCTAVLPQIVTLVTFIVGAVAGDARAVLGTGASREKNTQVVTHS